MSSNGGCRMNGMASWLECCMPWVCTGWCCAVRCCWLLAALVLDSSFLLESLDSLLGCQLHQLQQPVQLAATAM